MTNSGATHSRRDVLRTAAAAGATGLVASMAGCQQVKNAVGLGSNRTKQVPEDADAAFYVDVQAARNDEAVEKLANVYFEQLSESDYYEGPGDYEEAKEQFEEESDLDPSKAKWQITFSGTAQSSAGEYYGTLFKAGWDEDDMVDAYEDDYDISYDDDEHEGQTVYEPDEEYAPYLGVISGNKYVTGRKDAVEDAIDVAKSGGDKMDEELRKAYGNTKNAPVRFVSTMPSWVSEAGANSESEELDTGALEDVERAAGAVYKNGNKRGVEVIVTADDDDAAEDVQELVEGYFAMVENEEGAPEAVKTIADESTVEQNGADIVVTYEAEVSELEEMLEDSFDATGSGSSSVQTNVQAGASIDFGASDGVRVLWTSNQNADALYVTFINDTSGEREQRQLTGVGDATTYSCSGGDTVRVQVVGQSGDQSTVITSKTGEC